MKMFKQKKNRRKDSYTKLNKVTLVRGGKPYFDCLLQMIGASKETIHLQTYIFEDDETGQLVAEALKAAAKRKVTVYLMVDAFGSDLSQEFVTGLREAGIHFRFFEPVLKTKHLYFGRRMHHKVTVVDTRYALVGGVNITNRYNDMPDEPAWLDFALLMAGEIAKKLCVLCWKGWKDYPQRMGLTPCEQREISFDIPADEAVEIAMRRNDWVRRKIEISRTYINLFRNAESEVTILCSYFLPGRIIRRYIEAATRRGVKVKVITAGTSDIWLSKYAERYMYDWLLRKKVEIYEYNPKILHGKVAVCDSKWMTLGSYNLNNLSAYASIELNMNVRNAGIATEMEKTLVDIIKNDCTAITQKYQSKTSNLFKRLARWFAYGFLRVVLYVSTFYFKQES